MSGLAAAGAARLLAPRNAPAPSRAVDLHEHFSPSEIERGRRFARPQLAIALTHGALQSGALLLSARRALGDGAPRFGAQERGRPALAGAALAAALGPATALPALPLRILARRRALRVGLATQSWRSWAIDQVKASAIGMAFAAVAGAGVVELGRRFPRGWWVAVALSGSGAGAALAALAPVLLDPLFNDFTPLPTGQTRQDVLDLADAAGVRVGQVYSVDASRRTTAANAYVTGLGPSKRVVLFDTLLERYDRDQVRVVVAHELAHVRHRDVTRSLAFAALVAPSTALAAGQLARALGARPDDPRALPTLALCAGVASVPAGLWGNRLSRSVERVADRDSLKLTGAVDAFVRFERQIALQNLADLDPPRWLTALLATHPPTAERIGLAQRYAKQAAR